MNHTNNSSNTYGNYIIQSYDLSIGNKDFNIIDLQNWNLISVHIDWADLTGTLDAVVKLQQRNYKTLNFIDIPTLSVTMDSASGGYILENTEWGGSDLNINVAVNGCTGGTIALYLILKRK